jgi:phage terminase large subunit GpA-like protein
MDPDLMETTCVCPYCVHGTALRMRGPEPCPHCDGAGYIDCDKVPETVTRETVAMERARVIVPNCG